MSIRHIFTLCALATFSVPQAQYFGTVWKGRVIVSGPGRTWDVELKLIGVGDSVKGFSYYQGAWYNRLVMPVKGYVDPSDGRLSWWHDSPYGFEDDGRRALDPMPPGIHYKLAYKKDEKNTESLEGMVSMSIWTRETWEREVRLERAPDSPFQDQWIGRLIEKSKKDTPPKTSTAGTKAGKKNATSNPAKPSKPISTATTLKLTEPSRKSEQPLKKDEPKTVKPAIVQKAPEKPPSVKADTVSAKNPVVTNKPPSPTPSRSIVAAPKTVQNKTQAKPTGPSAIQGVGRDTLSTSKKTAIPDSEVKSPAKPSLNEGAGRTEPIRPQVTVTSNVNLPPLLSRERVLVQEIPIQADTLWLNFYDPAEIDGDTVSIYLGDKPIAVRVGLGLEPHLICIPVAPLPENIELTMHAENMGRMPPNTALLILYMKGERHEISLESTDRLSATIRLKKQKPPAPR